MKRIALLVLAIVLIAVAGYAEPPDPFPVNLNSPMAYFDNRQANLSQQDPGGAYQPLTPESASGSYFQILTFVRPGGLLSSLDQVRKVEARHVEIGYSYSLSPHGCENWQNMGQIWWTVVRPSGWMAAGTWEFILKYTGTDGLEHKQVMQFAMDSTNPPRFMDDVSHLRIEKGQFGEYIVSWNAPGDPVITYMKGPEPWQNQNPVPENMMKRFNYRVTVFDETGLCPVWQSYAVHSPVTQRVTVTVSPGMGGRKIRTENIFYGGITPYRTTSRSILEIYLPVWPAW